MIPTISPNETTGTVSEKITYPEAWSPCAKTEMIKTQNRIRVEWLAGIGSQPKSNQFLMVEPGKTQDL